MVAIARPALPGALPKPMPTQRRAVEVRGELLRVPELLDQEMCAEGAGGTGKTRGILEYIHFLLRHYDGARALIARKVNRDLAGSAMETYREEVLQPWHKVVYYGGSEAEPPSYRYPNGSRLYISGLDKPTKVKSKQYNIAYINEATECRPDDLELVRSRLGRDDRMPFWQLIMDANPDAPTHWLNQRMNAGLCARLQTTHRDNPAFWDTRTQDWTAIGRRYVEETLAGLTGVRFKRLALGMWAAAEGTVYEGAWEPSRNNPPREQYTRGRRDVWGDCGIPPEWPRYMAIDWGYRAPMSVQWWAKLPDGDLLMYREIYTTMRTVEEVARDALGYMGWKLEPNGRLVQTRQDADPLPREIVADVDPGDRATWEAHFGLSCYPAKKGKDSISDGIQAVTRRMQEGRLKVLQGSLVARDPNLDDKKKPCGYVEELDAYVWDTRGGRAPKEVPMDDNDHAQDAARYLVQYFDREPDTAGGYLDFHAPGWY